jgi:hypothetical protein
MPFSEDFRKIQAPLKDFPTAMSKAHGAKSTKQKTTKPEKEPAKNNELIATRDGLLRLLPLI